MIPDFYQFLNKALICIKDGSHASSCEGIDGLGLLLHLSQPLSQMEFGKVPEIRSYAWLNFVQRFLQLRGV